MKTLHRFSFALIAGLLAIAPVRSAERPAHPNFIVIFTDDQGYGDLACFGATGFKTPAVDQMAAEGMKFTDFYVNCPVCSGSRAALLTGCHFQRVNIAPVLFPNSPRGLHPDEMTIAEVLKPAGYATACIGKWHLGHMPPCLPTMQGFDYYYGIPYSNDMSIDRRQKLAKDILLREGMTREKIQSEKPKNNVVPLMRGDEVIEYPADQNTLTRRYTEEVIRFIKANKDKPFFIYVPHSMCHVPLHASKEFTGRTKTKFGDVIEELDWSVGAILKAVKEQGLDEKTLVIFTTDNGAASGSSKPLRGKKATMFEGGIRVPCVMRWPGQIPAGKVCSEVAATIDVLPTLAKLAGVPLPKQPIDGKDIWPLMIGTPAAKSPHDAYVLVHSTGAVRSGQWKYYPPSAKQKEPMLFDLTADLSETTDVAAKHPEVVKKLQKAYDDLRADLKANSRPSAQLQRPE